MTEPRIFDLSYWINERYRIKTVRDQGVPPPWTPDPVMATTRWCNVHREDDAVTRWMRTNWSDSNSPVWWFVLGRMLNYVPTLKYLLDTEASVTSDLERIKLPLLDLRRRGEKVFTSAYTISTCGKRMDKIDYVVDWVVQACMEAGEPDWHTLEQAHGQLTCIDGLGSFLSAQVLADLKNTPGHPLHAAPDWWTWAAPGPGSLRGLNWFWHGAPHGPVTASKFDVAIQRAYDEVMPYVHDYVPRIGMQDFQNCLCEFSKYMKLKSGAGHARNKYHAG